MSSSEFVSFAATSLLVATTFLRVTSTFASGPAPATPPSKTNFCSSLSLLSMASPLLNWDTQAFEDRYNAIRYLSAPPSSLDESLGADLRAVLVVPPRNEKSRAALAAAESGKPVLFLNGEQYELNRLFLAAASTLASELDLDELACAELLQIASIRFGKDFDLVDAGRLDFVQRYEYILNILGYLISVRGLAAIVPQNSSPTLLKSLLASFKKIYALVQTQNDLIDKQKATGDLNNLLFVSKVSFMKKKLFDIHQLQAQVLFSLLDTYIAELGTWDSYSSIVASINESLPDDTEILLLHFLPSLMRIVSSLSDIPDDQVAKIHLNFLSVLSADHAKVNSDDVMNLSNSSVRTYVMVLQLVFFVSLIPWCKELPARTAKFDFEKDILKYVEWLISYGTLEQLLCYSAESAHPDTKVLLEKSNLYEFRPLLQRNFPSLKPAKFIYLGNDELLHVTKSRPDLVNLAKLCDYLAFEISTCISNNLLAPFFHIFFSSFINHAAIVLTLLRDSEEDFLLSSINRKELELEPSTNSQKSLITAEDESDDLQLSKKSHNSKHDANSLDLDEIATRAELDRFYLAFAFTYTNRPDLVEAFWAGDDANVAGFITWGLANNTSPLITATFCLLLGSLTSSGETASAKVWDFLISAQTGSSKRNDYSKISVESILHSLTYYVDALTENLEQDLNSQMKQQQRKQEFLFSKSYTGKREKGANEAISIQLSEDSVVFISGFLMLISFIVRNANQNSTLSKNLRQSAFNCFHPIIVGFLKFDNLIISAKFPSSEDKLLTVLFHDENRTIIINLILNLLSDFTEGEQNLDLRFKVWNTLDRWICHSLHELESNPSAPTETTRYAGVSISNATLSSAKSELTKLRILHRGINMKSGFLMSLTNVSEVVNFVKLMKNLLSPLENSANFMSPVTLLYPSNLGDGYRHKNAIGVWPYIEYLIVEVFAKSSKLKDKSRKLILQQSILTIIESSLREIDWNFVSNVAPTVLMGLQNEVDSFASLKLVSEEAELLSYLNFVKLHHSVAILNYLFDENASAALFDVINIGVESINMSPTIKDLVHSALESLNSVLALQNTFINELIPILKNTNVTSTAPLALGYGSSLSLALSTPKTLFDNVYFPTNLGTKGVSSFYEIVLFHIPSIVHVALYVGNSDLEIARCALHILSQLSSNPLFGTNFRSLVFLKKTRLLDIFSSVDESLKIQYGFIQQIQTITENLDIKFQVLQFLKSNLPETSAVTVSHILLGFDMRETYLELDSTRHEDILLLGLTNLLISSLELISEVDYSKGYNHNVGLGPAKLTSLIMEIIVNLCQNPISSKATLNFLRRYDLFSKLLTAQPLIDDMTTWENHKFDGKVQERVKNEFLSDGDSCEAFFCFIRYRKAVIQYLSTEFHTTTSLNRKEYYVKILLDGSEFLNGTPKILNFLDILNYQFYNLVDHKLGVFGSKYNLEALLIEVSKEKEKNDNIEPIMGKLIKLSCQIASQKLSSEDAKASFARNIVSEFGYIQEVLAKFISLNQLKSLQLECLHSWVQFVQVVTSEGVVNKSDFILLVFQIILPKVNNEYYEKDILFAEELMSLCVLIFDLYERENVTKSGEESVQSLQRLLPLFKTCVNGVLCLNSTAALRSDLYLLLKKCLQLSIKSKSSLAQLLSILRSTEKKFIDVVCNDSIYSEGTPRVTSLIFMESLIHLACLEKSSTILDALTRNNSLSLLVRSLKRTDEIITACDANGDDKKKSGISVDTLLYELTALKSTLYLLVRIAQTRQGASQLFQNEIFSLLTQLKFLAIDADLGMDLIIDYGNDSSSTNYKNARLNLSLDVPVSFGLKNHVVDDTKLISYYEFLVPTFQLVATMLLSLGPSYKPGILQVKELMEHFHRFVVGVLKRDSLIDEGNVARLKEDDSIDGLKETVRLLSLIDAVVDDGNMREGSN